MEPFRPVRGVSPHNLTLARARQVAEDPRSFTRRSTMRRTIVAVLLLALAPAARAANPWDVAKKAAGQSTTAKLEKEINKRLLDESRKNQCSFKSGTAELEKGCDPKAQRLAKALVDAKKRLNTTGVKNFKF